MTETFRLDGSDDGPVLWVGPRRFRVVQFEVSDITYGNDLFVRRRRAYIDLDSQWSLSLIWSEGSKSDNDLDRIAARDGAFAEEPETVEAAALQYGALVVGKPMPFCEPAMVRAMACELEMTHEDGPAPRWTLGIYDEVIE